MAEWRHNDDEARWEHGYYDLPQDRFIWNGYVTDEAIERVASPRLLAKRLYLSHGSVPPPLADHIPPQPDPNTVIYEDGPGGTRP